MNEWISVKDRLTKQGVDVLIFPPKSHLKTEPVYTAHRRQWEERHDTWEYIWTGSVYHVVWDSITHWMPLPDPPNEIESSIKIPQEE